MGVAELCDEGHRCPEPEGTGLDSLRIQASGCPFLMMLTPPSPREFATTEKGVGGLGVGLRARWWDRGGIAFLVLTSVQGLGP